MIIGRLTGEVAAIGLDHLLIDVNGVGYVALAGTRLLAKLQAGDRVTVQVETRVTEASITMFAFATDEERAWFVRLQDVPGVAGKSALAILDGLSPAEIMDAIALGDSGAFTRAKGIGKKLGERIITELAGNCRHANYTNAGWDSSAATAAWRNNVWCAAATQWIRWWNRSNAVYEVLVVSTACSCDTVVTQAALA